MAKNITAQVTGGAPKIVEACKVCDVKSKLGLSGSYSATVNGQPASEGDTLKDYDFVSFAASVKGGKPKTILRKKSA